MLGGLNSEVESPQVLDFKNISSFLLFIKTCSTDQNTVALPVSGDKTDFSSGPV